ncbi:MAG TPA: hypothetical protein VGJ79_04145 [Candidatus Dormibacteraeota bacterium]|jgi:hypothetical protein
MIAILMLACILLLTPAMVATISMVAPGELNQTTSWFRGFSRLFDYLAFAKMSVALGSVFWVSRVQETMNLRAIDN